METKKINENTWRVKVASVNNISACKYSIHLRIDSDKNWIFNLSLYSNKSIIGTGEDLRYFRKHFKDVELVNEYKYIINYFAQKLGRKIIS